MLRSVHKVSRSKQAQRLVAGACGKLWLFDDS
jgi:hypothetical protein